MLRADSARRMSNSSYAEPAFSPAAPRGAIESYLRAKDCNQPHWTERAFAEDAVLEMAVAAETIAFPPLTQGRAAITEVLVRRFAQTYETVRTFCLAPPPREDARQYSCAWLVGMSEKEGRTVRVGCGRYDWCFADRSPRLAERLSIIIARMETMPAERLVPVMHWLSPLAWPWCTVAAALQGMPPFAELEPVRRYLASEAA